MTGETSTQERPFMHLFSKVSYHNRVRLILTLYSVPYNLQKKLENSALMKEPEAETDDPRGNVYV